MGFASMPSNRYKSTTSTHTFQRRRLSTAYQREGTRPSTKINRGMPFPIFSEQLVLKDSIDFNDLIVVEKQVSKSQFISFLISYFRLLEPALRLVRYIEQHNALRIEYVNKSYRIKVVLIKFSQKYVVKDEQISMIIEKGKIKNTVVNL